MIRMRKKIFMIGLAGLLYINQSINVPYVYAARIESEKELKQELFDAGEEKESGQELFDYEKVYPIDANDKIWKELSTEEMRFEKTQIKPALVEKMDTETLLEAVIRNPMVYTIEDAQYPKDGVTEFLNNLNAGEKLLEREDVKEEIIKEYLSLQIPEKTLNDYSKMHSDINLHSVVTELLKDKEFSENVDKDIEIYHRVHFLEGIIQNDEIYSSLSAVEKMKIYNKSLELNKQKEKSEVFSYSPEGFFTDELLKDSDLNMGNILAKSAKEDEYEDDFVWTPRGTKVKVRRYKNNHVNSDAVVAEFEKSQLKLKENLRKTVVGHGYYWSNCHAYTWPGNSGVWLLHGNTSDFIHDGSYTKVLANRPTANYQKVMLNSSQHSAIVMNVTGTPRIQTKMNHSPVYECDMTVDFSSEYTIYQYNKVC